MCLTIDVICFLAESATAAIGAHGVPALVSNFVPFRGGLHTVTHAVTRLSRDGMYYIFTNSSIIW